MVDGSTTFQLVLPSAKRSQVIHDFHNEMGHLGRDKTLDLTSHRFCWPGMAKDVEAHITNCERCVKRKSPDPPKVSMVPILVSDPMELLAIDFLSLEKEKGVTNMCWW